LAGRRLSLVTESSDFKGIGQYHYGWHSQFSILGKALVLPM